MAGSTLASAMTDDGLWADARRRLLGNRLELAATSSLALDKAAPIDQPARHRLDARFALTPGVKLVGSYEIADGKAVKARTMRGGLSAWMLRA